MNWLIWRQHRKQWFVFLALLAVFVAVAIPSGLNFWHDYQRLSAACSQAGNCNATDLRDTIFNTQLDALITNAVKFGLLAIPFVLGLFWGVPLLAKEYAEKTNKLVWTQGISRKKWLTAKLAWVLGATVLYVGALSAVATWFSHTGNTVNHDRFSILAFSSQGMVPVAVAVFAVSVGILSGALFKKLIPALGVTIGLLLLAQVVVPLLGRTHYIAPKVYNTPSLLNSADGNPFEPTVPSSVGAWTVGEKMVNSKGEVFEWDNPPTTCRVARPEQGKEEHHAVIGRNDVFMDVDCMNSLGYHWEIKYQPSYRYWNFQRIESGLYILLALAALGSTYALVLKRDA
jgi:hypothetical protein